MEVAKEGVEKLERIGECERTTWASESTAEEGVVGEGIVPECTEWVPAGAPPELGLFCWRGPDTMSVVQLCRLGSANVHEAEASIRTFLFSVLFSTSYALFTSLNCSSAAFLSAALTSWGNRSGWVWRALFRYAFLT